MENTEEIYTDFARVYDELMDNTPYEMWCERLNRLSGMRREFWIPSVIWWWIWAAAQVR